MTNTNAAVTSANMDCNNNTKHEILSHTIKRDVHNMTVKKRNRGMRPHGRIILNNFTLEKEMNSLFIILSLYPRLLSLARYTLLPPARHSRCATLVTKSR